MGSDHDQGIHWEGTEEELARWIEHKQRMAVRFVERGYSVEWFPDGDNWMEIYMPERRDAHRPEIRASVKFYAEPSKHGIDQGRISKLTIQRCYTDLIAKVRGEPFEDIEIQYNYDRGEDVSELASNSEAEALYQAVLRELN